MTRTHCRAEAGYVSVMVALLFSTVLLGIAAFGVDTARWYVEAERVQKAADAAALAGVVFMPNDVPAATQAALASAARNGYRPATRTADQEGTVITVQVGERPSQLTVTITQDVDNQFGSAIGVERASVTRTATADFTSPAPMGSPCNTFGNQPPSQVHMQPTGFAGATLTHATCSATPNVWAAIQGPATGKVQGDRYSTTTCTSGVYGCKGTTNSERRNDGYFFAIKIQRSRVGKPVQLQLYDPAYVHTSITCSALPAVSSISTNNLNDYTTTDAKNRYSEYKDRDDAQGVVTNAAALKYCSGDYLPGGSTAASTPPTTSFAVREQTDTNDPRKGAVVEKCTAQYAPVRSVTLGALTRSATSTYDKELARIFHQWVPLCTFTPTREGDYYLQVRTNVPAGGQPTPNPGRTVLEYRDNPAVTSTATVGTTTAGQGLNAFAVRAVDFLAPTTPLAGVSVSGWSRMPVLQNAPGSTATFNLIRALPASKGQTISFEFFDPADGAGSSAASVRVIRPGDATGSIRSTANIAGCRGAMNTSTSYSALTNCTATVRGTTHNGQLQKMAIPIPSDYGCDSTVPGGCWFQVEVKFPSDVNVTDFTVWDANVGGDPVRLIE